MFAITDKLFDGQVASLRQRPARLPLLMRLQPWLVASCLGINYAPGSQYMCWGEGEAFSFGAIGIPPIYGGTPWIDNWMATMARLCSLVEFDLVNEREAFKREFLRLNPHIKDVQFEEV